MSQDKSSERKQADILLDLANEANLFHTSDDIGYADVTIDDHRETWRIMGKGFNRYLNCQYFAKTGGAPSSEARKSALSIIEARAHYSGPQRDIYVRCAELDGKIYLDLCDKAWRVVEVDCEGWRIVDEPPVRFHRSRGMEPLPEPVHGGSIHELRPFVNVGSDDDFVLIVSWALAALRGHGPYTVLVVSGEQGSAKSMFSTILRALLDPNTAPLRALPRDNRDLFIAAKNSHVLAFDNVSKLPDWTSDTLCRLSTGGGFSVRQLYSDSEEEIFEATRPIILNGIEEIIARQDLADRAIFLQLDPIPDEKRRTENELMASLYEARPRIIGALLDAVSHGLRMLPNTRQNALARMADFHQWGTACEGANWPIGIFERAYMINRDAAVNSMIEADQLALAICSLMERNAHWEGIATTLLENLDGEVPENARKLRSWPKAPNTLSNRLRRITPQLQKVGIEIFLFQNKRPRIIKIRRIPGSSRKSPSGSSRDPENSNHSDDLDDVSQNSPVQRPTAGANSISNGKSFEDAIRAAAERIGILPDWATIYEFVEDFLPEDIREVIDEPKIADYVMQKAHTIVNGV